jgi:hypothetical protein
MLGHAVLSYMRLYVSGHHHPVLHDLATMPHMLLHGSSPLLWGRLGGTLLHERAF